MKFTDWINLFSALCWPVCFWWMYRISKSQTELLHDLRKQAEEVHEVSQEERELTQKLHPKLDEVAEKVKAGKALPEG